MLPREGQEPPPPQPVTLSPLLCCDRQTSPSSQDHQLFTRTIFLNIDVKSKFPACPSPAFQMRFSGHKDPSSHGATTSEGKRDLAVTAPGWATGVRRRSHPRHLGASPACPAVSVPPPVPRTRPARTDRPRGWEEASGNQSMCLRDKRSLFSPKLFNEKIFVNKCFPASVYTTLKGSKWKPAPHTVSLPFITAICQA